MQERLKEKKINAWVNCARREWDAYHQLKEKVLVKNGSVAPISPFNRIFEQQNKCIVSDSVPFYGVKVCTPYGETV